jgi:hypothetical protein
MYATIRLSPYIFIQGRLTRELPGGVVAVEIDGREVVGPPVSALRPETPAEAALAR